MPRTARERSNSGIYHVMVRGINKQDIFLEREDFERYLGTLAVVKARSCCLIYGYCLLSNHVHLLVQEQGESVGQVMKRLGASYVRWYNNKYQRVGHLFQDRFRSEAVENDSYLLTVVRYIHRNAEEAGLVASCADYPWCSYRAYAGSPSPAHQLVDTSFVLGIIGGVRQFIKFSAAPVVDASSLDGVVPATSDADLRDAIVSQLAGRPLTDLLTMRKFRRDLIVNSAKTLSGVTNVQIARVTGLSLSAVQRATTANE